jgi:hypothetical protein
MSGGHKLEGIFRHNHGIINTNTPCLSRRWEEPGRPDKLDSLGRLEKSLEKLSFLVYKWL